MSGVGAIILAAGASTRMGQPKQLLRFQNESLVRRAAKTALGSDCSQVVVVVGAHADLIRLELADIAVTIAENSEWQLGMSNSIKAGLRALMDHGSGICAALVMTSDQPLTSTEKINELLAAHERTGQPVVASAYDGNLGVPALFHRSVFPQLLALDGATGARHFIASHRAQVATVDMPEGAFDVDTAEDFQRLAEMEKPRCS